MGEINYPEDIETNEQRYAYLYRLQELLRLEHNQKGQDYKNEIITEEEWKLYLNDEFNPKSDLISSEIQKYRELLKNDEESSADLSDIVM